MFTTSSAYTYYKRYSKASYSTSLVVPTPTLVDRVTRLEASIANLIVELESTRAKLA